MSEAEACFKQAVTDLLDEGIYPGPVQIRRRLGRPEGSQTINGQQMKWRAEVMEKRGWVYDHDPKRRHSWRFVGDRVGT